MSGAILGLLVALAGLAFAAWIGRQERTPWRPVMLAGVAGIAGLGALKLSGLDQRGVVSSVGAFLMYGAVVIAVAHIAGGGRG
jgi:hypothetical protein